WFACLCLRDAIPISISVTLSNTGDRAGQEVVQLYVGARDSKVERANKELKAFTKVALAPGQTRVLQLEVPVQELAYYDSQSGWVDRKSTRLNSSHAS